MWLDKFGLLAVSSNNILIVQSQYFGFYWLIGYGHNSLPNSNRLHSIVDREKH